MKLSVLDAADYNVCSAPHLPSVGRLNAVSWRVDYTLSSSELKEVKEPLIQLKLQMQGAESGSTQTTVVSISADKFRVLLAGLFCMLSKLQILFLCSLSILDSLMSLNYLIVLFSPCL